MVAYSLMMPPEQMRKDLFNNAYDIDFLLNKYNYLEKSSVLHWITILNPLPCHFVWLLIEKDITGNIVRLMAHDNCFYDQQNDPKPFIIQSVLNEPQSAAAEAIRDRKNVKKESAIQGTEYYCYAYYEPDLSMEVIKDYFPCSINVRYDRLLVIGWTKQINYTIQMMKQMRNDS
jgi:hypothetical protein